MIHSVETGTPRESPRPCDTPSGSIVIGDPPFRGDRVVDSLAAIFVVFFFFGRAHLDRVTSMSTASSLVADKSSTCQTEFSVLVLLHRLVVTAPPPPPAAPKSVLGGGLNQGFQSHDWTAMCSTNHQVVMNFLCCSRHRDGK